MKQREALTTSRIKLNEMLGNEDVTALLGIRDTTIDVNPGLRYDELWEATLSANSSLLLADKNTDIVRADYKKIMSRDYPYVRLNLGYGYTMNRYELSSTRKRDNWGLNAGITVEFKLFDGKRKMQKKERRTRHQILGTGTRQSAADTQIGAEQLLAGIQEQLGDTAEGETEPRRRRDKLLFRQPQISRAQHIRI